MKIKEQEIETNQLKPAEIVRDEMGAWSHPDYCAYLDKHHADEESVNPAAQQHDLFGAIA